MSFGYMNAAELQ